MRQSDLDFLKKWFSDYCRSFHSADADEQRNIMLKEQHTGFVCTNAVDIAEDCRLGISDMLLAETAALFHDLGRFEQYLKYKTFRDSISVNHAVLGATILKREGILSALPEEEQTIILNVVRFHNSFRLHHLQSPRDFFFLKLVRDADKLDIWRIFLELFEGRALTDASGACLGLPDLPEYTDEVLTFVQRGQIVPLASVRSLHDFKLMQLSWVCDLNFRTSYRRVIKDDLFQRFIGLLPRTREISTAVEELEKYARHKLENSREGPLR